MHPEEIKAALKMRGYTQAMLADELQVANSSVHQAITGLISSQRIQQRIAEILEKNTKSIWPNQVRLRRTREEIELQRAQQIA